MVLFRGEFVDDSKPIIDRYSYSEGGTLSWYKSHVDINGSLIRIQHRTNGPARITVSNKDQEPILTCEWIEDGKHRNPTLGPCEAQAILKLRTDGLFDPGFFVPEIINYDFGFTTRPSPRTDGPTIVGDRGNTYIIPCDSFVAKNGKTTTPFKTAVDRDIFVMFYEVTYLKEYQGDPTEEQICKWKKDLLRAYSDYTTWTMLDERFL